MASVAAAGAAARIAARTFCKVPRAGSGTPARYSSMVAGGGSPLVADPRFAAFVFFMLFAAQALRIIRIESSGKRNRSETPFASMVDAIAAA
jgi:hypothetical protein